MIGITLKLLFGILFAIYSFVYISEKYTNKTGIPITLIALGFVVYTVMTDLIIT